MKNLKLVLIGIAIVTFTSCEIVEDVICCTLSEYDICNNEPEPPISLAAQALECGGAEYLTANQIDSQEPSFYCNSDLGQPVNWWKFKKDSPLPGSGSISVYDNTENDYTNATVYFTVDDLDQFPGYLSFVSQIDTMGIDSVHYTHPQQYPNDPCLSGPNAISNGPSSTISIECYGWAIVGQQIFMAVE